MHIFYLMVTRFDCRVTCFASMFALFCAYLWETPSGWVVFCSDILSWKIGKLTAFLGPRSCMFVSLLSTSTLHLRAVHHCITCAFLRCKGSPGEYLRDGALPSGLGRICQGFKCWSGIEWDHHLHAGSLFKCQWLAFKLCLLGCSFVATHQEDQSKSYLGMFSSHPLPRSATMRPGPSVRFALRLRFCGLLEDSHNQRNRESRERYPPHLKNGWLEDY